MTNVSIVIHSSEQRESCTSREIQCLQFVWFACLYLIFVYDYTKYKQQQWGALSYLEHCSMCLRLDMILMV